jgi:hypothetical protein
MKNTLENLLQAGKNIGSSIRSALKKNAKIGLTALALATPFALADKARASEGEIIIEYIIDIPYTTSDWALGHFFGASEGIDDYDEIYFSMFNPSGVASKITSTVEGKELNGDARPVKEPSTVNFSYKVITQDGIPVPEIYNPYFAVETEGFNEEDVKIEVEGVTYDAKTVETIPLTSLTGSGTVSFYPYTHDPNDQADPNDFEDLTPSWLAVHSVFDKALETKKFEFSWENGAAESASDSNDVIYSPVGEIESPRVISDANGIPLVEDARIPREETLDLEYRFHSECGYANYPLNIGQSLVFSFSERENNKNFGDWLITFQDVTDMNNLGEIFYVREEIENGGGYMVFNLEDIPKRTDVYSGIWGRYRLGFEDLSAADFSKDGRVDLRDYSFIVRDFGNAGKLDPDLDMDGKTGYRDLRIFFDKMSKDMARRAVKRNYENLYPE